MDDGPVTTGSTPSSTAPDLPARPPAPKPAHVSPWARDPLHALQNSLLRFLSQASNETLGACVVGLAASTYLVLGRIGLVLIGAVGGVTLHARWESLGLSGGPESQAIAREGQRKRNELGIEVAKRALDWRHSKRADPQSNEDDDDAATGSGLSTDTKPTDFSDVPPETQDAVNKFTDAIIRDYVKWWYHPLLPTDQSFPAACRQTLAKLIAAFTNHLARKRTADPILDFLANSTSIIIVFLNELSAAMKTSQRQDPVDAIRTYLQDQPESPLANVLNRDQQEKKLNIIADDVLHNFLEPSSYNSFPVKTFLREVLSGLILKRVIDGQAKADSINGGIVYLLEDGEPELMNAIDAGVDGAAAKLKDSAERPSPHQRRLSRAEEAMEDAMKEVERMNAMIAEEEARRQKESSASDHKHMPSIITTPSTEAGSTTPTSSDSEPNRIPRRSRSVSYLLDAEGNAITSPKSSPTKQSIDLMTSELPAQPEENLLSQQPVDLQSLPLEAPVALPLTLHKASITIMDLGDGDENVIMKKDPAHNDWLVQIEPASSRFPGWMVMKRYADFVRLHERLMTYARIGVPQFTLQHPEMPSWRGIARRTLCSDLEFYLRDALKYEGLAESEAMKKFLEKETGIAKAGPQTKNVLVQGGAALENVGKNFVNVLGQGGKGIAGGGKVVIGGVQGAFGAITAGVGGTKKLASQQKPAQSPVRVSTATIPSQTGHEIPVTGSDAEPARAPPLAPRLKRMSSDHSHQPSQDEFPVPLSEEEILHLPLPPTEISDEYIPVAASTPSGLASRPDSPEALTPTSSILPSVESPAASKMFNVPAKPQRQNEPLTAEETRVLVELMFAIITELYSLSPSAWTIRLSLLSAAKTFLLRPQNPQLESIRILLQESVLDANFSDKGLAAHINKLRQVSAPTPEEQAKSPKPLTPEESQKLRVKARMLLVERGMPQALTSVMGQQASGEALGKVFDCLQIEEIARGFVFALLLQALRAASQ
ncbi:hypothetical protein DV736_g382, partial [Chaetothyriales sp. CBS 134916]